MNPSLADVILPLFMLWFPTNFFCGDFSVGKYLYNLSHEGIDLRAMAYRRNSAGADSALFSEFILFDTFFL